jgi:rhomboid protease GluP
MPFFVYGSNAQTGEVARRFYSEAATEAEARKHAEAHGMRVSSVVACSAQQRAPAGSVLTVRERVAAEHARRAPVQVQGAAARAAALAARGHPPAATVDPQLKSEMAAFEETLERRTPSVYVAYALIGANLLVFVLMTAFGVSAMKPTIDDLLRWGADFGPDTSHGEWWRLFTSTFVHIGMLHVSCNMLVLAYIGPRVERMLGNGSFLLVYLVSGLGGSLLALEQNPLQVQAGASGAIFGIYGALFAVLLRERDSIPQHVAAHLKKYVTTFIAYNLIYSLSPGISLAAHLGGLVTGFICGFAVAQPLDDADTTTGRPLRNASVAAVGALVVLLGVVAVRMKYPNLDRVGDIIAHAAAVEKQSRLAFVDAKRHADEDQLSNAGFAGAIETKVLPDWRSARDEIGQLAYLPSPKIDAIDHYMRMRQRQLENLDDALRSNNSEAVKNALADGKYSSDRLSNWSAGK